jgi:hypothetical protein
MCNHLKSRKLVSSFRQKKIQAHNYQVHAGTEIGLTSNAAMSIATGATCGVPIGLLVGAFAGITGPGLIAATLGGA